MTRTEANRAVGRLFEGPLDIIGDVHGELEALDSLTAQLGYAADGTHPAGRRAVFIGDVCDRGPDSPGVLNRVMSWVQAGLAQCVLGNHELNVLLGAPKHGNGWFFDRNHDAESGHFLDAAQSSAEERAAWMGFLDTLPIALQRADLRVVHACWDGAALDWLHGPVGATPYAELHDRFVEWGKRLARTTGIDHDAALEFTPYKGQFRQREAILPMMPAVARKAVLQQNSNPLKVLTSGVEAPAPAPSWAGGMWRMTKRAQWWNDYYEIVPVVVGHYWRVDAKSAPANVTGDWDYVFEDYGAYEWLGPKGNVFCVDYSAGGRYVERRRGRTSDFECRLAALRWPECELVFDDGERVPAPRVGR
jgi:hypothetical protein